jgi:hypothetical protein
MNLIDVIVESNNALHNKSCIYMYNYIFVVLPLRFNIKC